MQDSKEEKYQSSCLNLSWNKKQLIQVLDLRINFLVKDQYTSTIITHQEILPTKVGRQSGIDYILDRTLMRPRDVIQFFNECIKKAEENRISL